MSSQSEYKALIGAGSGLQSYWPYDEASGNVVDAKGSIGGTANGSLTYSGTGKFQIGPGISAPGTGADYLDFGANYGFAGTASMTVEAWIRPGASNVDGRILAREKVVTPYGGWVFALIGGKLYYCRNKGDGTNAYFKDWSATTTTLASGTWYHVAVTYSSGNEALLYVNGVLESATKGGTSDLSFPSPYSVGTTGVGNLRSFICDNTTYGRLNARLMHVAVYNAELSAATLLDHYKAGGTAYLSDSLGLTDSITGIPKGQTINDTLGMTEGDGLDFSAVALATSGIQSLWKLNETSGSSIADSAGAITGTKGSAVTLAGAELYLGAGYAATFTDSATNAIVDLGNNYKHAGTTAFSVEAWFLSTNFTGTGGSNGIIGAWDGTSGWRFVVLGSGKVALVRYDSSGANDLIVGSKTLSTGVAYLLGCSYDGTTVKLYVNGVLDGSGTSTRSITASSTNLKIGAALTGYGSMIGRLGPIAKYSRALTASEFAAHYLPTGPADVSTTPGYGLSRTINDPLGLTDGRAGAPSWSKTDALGLTDSVSYEIGGRRDWITISDSVVVTQTGSSATYTRTITDTLGILDPRSRTHAAARGRDDTLGLTDAVTYQKLGNVATRPFIAPLDVASVTAPLDVVAATAPLDMDVEV